MSKLYVVTLSLLAGMLLVPGAVMGQDTQDLPDALRQAYGGFATAMVAGDAQTAATYYSPDAVVLADHETVYRGRAAIRERFLDYAPSDLRLVDRALELLSSDRRWNAQKEGSPCPENATQWSLRCALFEAARQVGEDSIGHYAVAYDAIYEAFERLDDGGPFRSSLRRYNNHESTGLEDIRSLLVELRERAASSL